MAIDRKSGPPIQSIRQLELPDYQVNYLDNNIPVYTVNKGSQELIKIDITFHGGRHKEDYKTQSQAHGSLLKDGSMHHTSEQLSDLIDYYGASYSTKASLDYTTVTLFCLTKFFEKLCPIIAELLYEPIFPEEEVQKFIRNRQQSLKLTLSKNEMVAYRELSSLLFGPEQVYGYNSQPEDYESNTSIRLRDFHHQMLQSHSCRIFITGKFDQEKTLSLVNSYFGQYSHEAPTPIEYVCEGQQNKGEFRVASKNKHQVCLRMGQHFGNRMHPDYTKLNFLSNVLGGFFGSRLMKNIREDKGYTYNIYSDLDIFRYDGYFYIHTELDHSNLEKVQEEIYTEFEKLKSEPIPLEELEMNKNYIMGNLLHATDGPFNAATMVKSMVLNSITNDMMQDSILQINQMTSEDLMAMAQKYLNKEDFANLIVA